MIRIQSAFFLIFFYALLLGGCAGHKAHKARKAAVIEVPEAEAPTPRYRAYREQSGDFTKPAELEPQVEFWKKVYSRWSQSQAAIHDDRYMEAIYEVADIPGSVGSSLTADQKDWLKGRRDFWKTRLADLEDRVAARQPLDRNDKEILAMLGGSGKLSGAAERVRSQRGMKERFRRGLEISRSYDRHFRRIFRDAGLPEDLAYLPHVESSFQAAAKSSAGAVGIWQFTKGAAVRYMTVNEVVDERLDPVAAAHGAARYLRDAYDRLGSWPLAVTSYNHGMNGMKKAKNIYGDDYVRIVAE